MDEVAIIVKGHIDAHWSVWLAGLQITHLADDRTLLSGTIVDQAMLYGILTKLRDLDLKMVSMQIEEGVHHE